jgi:hypothetical protein
MTGQPRGCAFVSYASKAEGEMAIHSLDKGVHLPGALCPMEVGGTYWQQQQGHARQLGPQQQGRGAGPGNMKVSCVIKLCHV